jgi:hypothetical protein
MAAVKARGATSGKKAGATELAITLPAGTASADLAILVCQSSASTASFTEPAGWTLLAESVLQTESGGARSVAIFTRKLTGTTGENLPTIKASVSGSLGYAVQVIEAGTYDTSAPVDVHSAWKESAAGAELEVTLSDGTTTIAGDLGLLILSESQKPTAVPTGWALQTESNNTTYTYTKAELASGATVSAAVVKNTKIIYWGYLLAVKALSEETTGHQVMVV